MYSLKDLFQYLMREDIELKILEEMVLNDKKDDFSDELKSINSVLNLSIGKPINDTSILETLLGLNGTKTIDTSKLSIKNYIKVLKVFLDRQNSFVCFPEYELDFYITKEEFDYTNFIIDLKENDYKILDSEVKENERYNYLEVDKTLLSTLDVGTESYSIIKGYLDSNYYPINRIILTSIAKVFNEEIDHKVFFTGMK